MYIRNLRCSILAMILLKISKRFCFSWDSWEHGLLDLSIYIIFTSYLTRYHENKTLYYFVYYSIYYTNS